MIMYEKPKLRFEEICLGESIADTCFGYKHFNFKGTLKVDNKSYNVSFNSGTLHDCSAAAVFAAIDDLLDRYLNKDITFDPYANGMKDNIGNTKHPGFYFGELQS